MKFLNPYLLLYLEILKYVNNHGGPNQTNTNGFKRAILWGMAIHSATDTYAHSSALHGNRITHGNNYSSTVADADNKNYITWRYRDAAFVANKIMEKYNNRSSLSATILFFLLFILFPSIDNSLLYHNLIQYVIPLLLCFIMV